MDIIKTPASKPFYLEYWYLLLGLLCLGLFVLVSQKYRKVSGIVLGDGLLVETVQRGELVVSVRGYGQLSPKDVYWIGSESDGRVERVFVRAGDSVQKGDVLIQLFNPQLLQSLKEAELEYDAQQADLVANQIGLETQNLDLQTEVDNAEIDYLIQKSKLDANNELMAKGTQIISRIELERDKLVTQQYLQRWEMQKKRVLKNDESKLAQQAAQKARLLQTKNTRDKIKAQVDGLAIRATVEGIVQEMNLELGQQVKSGENISRIAKLDELIAEVQIPELQVNEIQVGMKTAVDTRTSIINGVVSRIDPAVVDGSVMVEIELYGALPQEVRPDLNIEANIEIAFIDDALYVSRPVFSRAHSNNAIYRVNQEGDIAERVNVQYGQASTSYIQILDGAELGDRLITSDPTALGNKERILIR